MIDGVELKELVTFPDERGFFREVIRVSDDFFQEGFGQFSHSLMHQGVIKAWHIHPKQIDWWYVPLGVMKVALYDTRPESPTYQQTDTIYIGDAYGYKVLKIPAGVAHGCKALTGPTHLMYVTSNTYDLEQEGRIPYDDAEIGYDWLSGPPIK